MVKCLIEFSEFPLFCKDILKELRSSKYFADVTLVGDDNIPVKAHKIVLCAHSSVLKESILSLDYDKLVLQCRGFKSQDIQSLLDFIYLGEVSSGYKDANVLFKLGKFLKIRHLGDECDLSLEDLDNKFQIEAIEVLGEEEDIVKEECIETETESKINEKVEYCADSSAKIVYKAKGHETTNQLEEKQEIYDTFCIDDQSSSKEKEQKERKINVKNFEMDFDTYLGKSKNTKKSETTIVRLYNSVMEGFSKVDPSKKWKPIDETTDEEELNTNLCKFFMCLVKPDGTPYNSSSKKSYLAAIKRYLIQTKNISLDRVGRFKELHEIVWSHRDESEVNTEEVSAIREDDINKCFSAGTMGQSNPRALLTLVLYNLMVDFGCTSAHEVHDLLNSDFIYGPLNQSREPEYIQLSDRVLNLRKRRTSNKSGRIELNSGVLLHGTSPVRNILLYQSRKTSKQLESDHPFLLNPARFNQKIVIRQDWFENLRLGINSIFPMFKKAFLEAGVDLSGRKITLTSAKKSRPNFSDTETN